MRKTKHLKTRKTKKSRNIRRHTRKNKTGKKMKGGTTSPFGADLADAFSSLKYQMNQAVGVATVPPVEVPPNIQGGDNPLPFQQLGPAA
jgi:hypothetical protein